MSKVASLIEDIAALGASPLPAQIVLREIERINHLLVTHPDYDLEASKPEELKALHRAISSVKAALSGRIATLTLLRDAVRSHASEKRSRSGFYDRSGAVAR